jgi:hypothetical protein
VAPALSGVARQLDFQRTSIELDKKFDTRMDKDRLLEQNILRCERV